MILQNYPPLFIKMLNFSEFFQNLFIVHIFEHIFSAFEKLFQNFPNFFQNFIKFLRKVFTGSLQDFQLFFF